MTRAKDLTQGSIKGHLTRLALPLILGNILQQMYNTIDAAVIGRFAGELEFSSVGVASAVMNLLIFLIVGASTGLSIIFSQLYGRRDVKEFRKEHFLAVSLGSLLTIALSAVSILAVPLLLHLTQTPAEIFAGTALYLRVVLLGLPFAFIYNLYSALLRATGNTRQTLIVLFLSVVANLVLDLTFVAGLGLGLMGAAVATVIAQGLSAGFSLLIFNRMLPDLRWEKADRVWKKDQVRRTLRISLVTAVHQASLYVGKLMVQGAVNAAGTEIIAAYTAATRIEGFANSFGDSGASATSVVTAQNYGAGKNERVRKTFWDSLWLLLAMGIVCSVILFIGAKPFVGLLLGKNSGIAFSNAASYLRLVALFYVFCFTGNTFAGYLDGTGRVSIPFIGAAGHITLRVLLSWLLIGKMQLPAVALATGIGWVLVNLFWAAYVARKAACPRHSGGRHPIRASALRGSRRSAFQSR